MEEGGRRGAREGDGAKQGQSDVMQGLHQPLLV